MREGKKEDNYQKRGKSNRNTNANGLGIIHKLILTPHGRRKYLGNA